MTNHMIGKVLQGRYQIVQILDAGVFGQTYIAVDTEQPEQHKCVIKQLKVASSQPEYLQTQRLHFLSETETLKHLGKHEQIPKLIACFEEKQRFYLVQEFIEGHALTAELPIHQRLGYPWSENDIIELLHDVLGILEFVHSQGVIHCDIKPDNLIRRACDGKLVLIDFGAIQAIDVGTDAILPIDKFPVTSLGYIPPEQFIGQTQPNSDIYALGMIAIQALTGLSPLQLKIDPCSNEMIWRSEQISVSDRFAAILSQMIRHNYQARFQSTTEVLQALKQISTGNGQPQAVQLKGNVLLNSAKAEDNKHCKFPKSSPLAVGMKVGLVANSLAMGFGLYALINNSPVRSETDTLYKATKAYQAGDLEEAIALAKKIPSTSNVYPEAQATIAQWQNQWQTAAEKYLTAEKALHEGRWVDALNAASQVPDNLYWQTKTDKIVEQAKVKIEAQTHKLLTKAYQKASVKDFNTALAYLHQVPSESSANTLVQQKLAEYNQKKQVRAVFLLQQAYRQAAVSKFEAAIEFLQQIPKNTSVYATAQVKLIEYTHKQHLQAEAQKLAKSKMPSAVKIQEVINRSRTNANLQSFAPESDLQEVNTQLQTRL
ncbi:MAG: serine/threonine protein kinase [Chlorogloeopsis fritschii C42_A2020_084]|uniref:serine/threonine-protein kinase n=1 Tax=Chlorogloeopsis fritschii TaxID=1124 RepID=UPI0019D9AA76|nr:serine/threonine-protein kinase [Chlorogloeopsis fritschii]MBF2006173.1 serine/threonine protein kinase [Chlorogloeopsis fritschii C42_A2020_084]